MGLKQKLQLAMYIIIIIIIIIYKILNWCCDCEQFHLVRLIVIFTQTCHIQKNTTRTIKDKNLTKLVRPDHYCQK